MWQVGSFARSAWAARALAALLLIVIPSQRVSANTIFVQAPVNNANGYVSDFDEPLQRADDFSLGAGATVESIRWWGFYFGNVAPASTDFALRFYADSAGTPSSTPFYDQPLLGAARVDSGLTDGGGGTLYQFTANLPVTLGLAGGTTFYASLVENDPGNSTWFWAADGAGPHWRRSADGDAWSDSFSNANLSFELNDAAVPAIVPTPTAAAGGIALLGMLIAIRRPRFGETTLRGN